MSRQGATARSALGEGAGGAEAEEEAGGEAKIPRCRSETSDADAVSAAEIWSLAAAMQSPQHPTKTAQNYVHLLPCTPHKTILFRP
mmetsp:Transcript_11095/g.22920  ORF Transcript_11095/g.22920 Transcript_11095/m.22920 type:complete len:86 (+) Transcript_11095:347-604(+)